MEYRFLGSSGLKISALSFGAWVTFGDQVDEDLALEMMEIAFDAGVNFFDNAEAYARGRAETIMGNVLKRAGWKRSDLVISTKIFWGGDGPNDTGLSRKHIIEGALASLDRLQLDYVDLVFCHRPDLDTPVEETVRSMNYLLDHGLAFYWGTSEWSAQQIMDAYGTARREGMVPPLMEQPQYNMFHRQLVERELAPLFRKIGLGTTVWSPLASGLLTGKYNRGIPEGSRLDLEGYDWLKRQYNSEEGQRQIEKVRQLSRIADELDCSMAQLALAWCLKNPNVSSVITGASKPEQVRDNMKALNVVPKLTDEVMGRIEDILENKPEPEPDFR
jgi:voltage-dependent potassium channel beta subunit